MLILIYGVLLIYMVFRLLMLSKDGIQSFLYTRKFFEYSVFGIRIIMRMPCPVWVQILVILSNTQNPLFWIPLHKLKILESESYIGGINSQHFVKPIQV